MHHFDELLTLVRVVEAESLTAAAERLNVTKSVVSRRLANLEQRLKVKLITRTTRRVIATELGRAYYEHCVRILAELDEATSNITGQNMRAWGTLRLAAPMTFGNMHLTPVLSELLADHPDLLIEIELNDRVVDIVAEGFDVAVRIGKLKDSTLIARKLAPIRRVLCASPGYLVLRGEPMRPEDLYDHDCLSYCNAASSELWSFVSGPLKRPIPARRLRANNGEMLRDAAVAGLGIAVLPSFIVGSAVERGELKILMADHPLEALGLYAVYPPSHHLAFKIRVLVDALARRFGPAPYWDETCAIC